MKKTNGWTERVVSFIFTLCLCSAEGTAGSVPSSTLKVRALHLATDDTVGFVVCGLQLMGAIPLVPQGTVSTLH